MTCIFGTTIGLEQTRLQLNTDMLNQFDQHKTTFNIHYL